MQTVAFILGVLFISLLAHTLLSDTPTISDKESVEMDDWIEKHGKL